LPKYTSSSASPPFDHDFENVSYEADRVDAHLGTPGLHRVGRKIAPRDRKNLLPPEIMQSCRMSAFWLDPARNPNNVHIV